MQHVEQGRIKYQAGNYTAELAPATYTSLLRRGPSAAKLYTRPQLQRGARIYTHEDSH